MAIERKAEQNQLNKSGAMNTMMNSVKSPFGKSVNDELEDVAERKDTARSKNESLQTDGEFADDQGEEKTPGCCSKFCGWLNCCKETEVGDPKEKEEIELPTHIKVVFSERSCCNKCLYLLYKLFRFNFVAFWFYFIPFFAMILSYILPWYFNTYYPLSAEELAAMNAGDD